MKRVHPASFLEVKGEVESKEEGEQRKACKSLTLKHFLRAKIISAVIQLNKHLHHLIKKAAPKYRMAKATARYSATKSKTTF